MLLLLLLRGKFCFSDDSLPRDVRESPCFCFCCVSADCDRMIAGGQAGAIAT